MCTDPINNLHMYILIFIYLRNSWDGAKGLSKKFFYLKEKQEEKLYVIDISINDLRKIGKSLSFVKLVEAKIKALELDTKYENLIIPHEAETYFKNKI